MIQLIRNKAYAGVFLFIVATGLLFYNREDLSQRFLSDILNYEFNYFLSPFMPLISLLLVAVNIGLIATLVRNEHLELKEKVSAASKHLLCYLIVGVLGWTVHIGIVYQAMQSKSSMALIEQNIILYHISDFSLVIGFIMGATMFLRKKIHYGKIDF